MTIFSASELDRRQDAVRDRLDGADACVVFSFTNSYYLSGAPILHWGRPAITVMMP